MAYGIDVSHWQSTIDWAKVRQSGRCQFAILKATEGSGWKDDRFEMNRRGCIREGIPWGGYHFFSPQYDAEEQADNFFASVGEITAGNLIPWIDVEFMNDRKGVSLSTATQRLAMMVVYCEERFGKPVGLYTAAWAWNGLPHQNRFGQLPLWVASYGGTVGVPMKPAGWTRYAVHQYTSSGIMPGISTEVDLNYIADLSVIQKDAPVNPKAEIQRALAEMRQHLAQLDSLVSQL